MKENWLVIVSAIAVITGAALVALTVSGPEVVRPQGGLMVFIGFLLFGAGLLHVGAWITKDLIRQSESARFKVNNTHDPAGS